MLERMLGAARLNVHTYEEVENDESATMQAMLVVVIVSIATGIGFVLAGAIWAIIIGIIWSLIGWAIWALITFWLGTKMFNTPETHASWGQLARVTAFAQTPGLLRVLGIVPSVGPVFVAISVIWVLVAMVIGVRQALDYDSTLRAVGVVIVGGIVYIIMAGIFWWIISLL